MTLKFSRAVLATLYLTAASAFSALRAETFDRRWTYVSETSAVIYWQLGDIGSAASSWVEYGPTDSLGLRTAQCEQPRQSQLHRLNGLDPGATYYYRMVAVDTATGQAARSEILSLSTRKRAEAVRIPRDVSGPPYILDKPHTY